MIPRFESNSSSRTRLSLRASSGRCAMGSENSDGISGPLKTRLSNPKRIFSGPNATEVNIDPQTHNVIMQFRHPRRAQKLVAPVTEEPDFIGSFFAPNRKIKHQVL